jgi:hypothetical protein
MEIKVFLYNLLYIHSRYGMKWKSHIEIAEAIGCQLDLPSELKEVLRQGSIQPDREGDKVIERGHHLLLSQHRVRHHRPSKLFIRKLLWKARAAYIEGREEDALWCLGRALHYVQDRSVATGPFSWFHDEREAEIGHIHVFPDAVQLGIEASTPSPFFINLCLRTLSPKKRTRAAMHQACMLSSALAFAVLSDPTPSRRLSKEVETSERRHWRVYLPAALTIGLITSSLGFWLDQPLLVASSIPLAILTLMLDTKRNMFRKEALWFAFV